VSPIISTVSATSAACPFTVILATTICVVLASGPSWGDIAHNGCWLDGRYERVAKARGVTRLPEWLSRRVPWYTLYQLIEDDVGIDQHA